MNRKPNLEVKIDNINSKTLLKGERIIADKKLCELFHINSESLD
jgi:hypothetical protein